MSTHASLTKLHANDQSGSAKSNTTSMEFIDLDEAKWRERRTRDQAIQAYQDLLRSRVFETAPEVQAALRTFQAAESAHQVALDRLRRARRENA